tara:strand:+ start:10820 stop:13333 length:2514 start_codon:yes stop_codon:yes gene_type:complete
MSENAAERASVAAAMSALKRPSRRRSAPPSAGVQAPSAEENTVTLSYPDLPRVHAPVGARAVVQQAWQEENLRLPRGMDGAPPGAKLKRPSDGSALWMPHLYTGYVHARCVGYARHATEVAPMIHSEEVELKDGFLGVEPASGSLRPRSLGAWLLICGPAVHSSTSRDYLDAFAQLATRELDSGKSLASRIRMSVLAGDDAATLLSQSAATLVADRVMEVDRLMRSASTVLLMRWAVAAPGEEQHVLRSEMVVLNQRNVASLDAALSNLCTGMLDVGNRYALDLPPEIAGSGSGVARDAFAKTQAKAAHDFFVETTGSGTKTLSSYASSAAFFGKRLEDAQVRVRIVPWNEVNNRWEATTSDRCMHGMLLCHPDRVSDTMLWAKEHEREGLVLDATYQVDWALHLCASWVEPVDLASNVTLYGPLGVLRQPMTEHGSKVWKLTPVICPLDDRLTARHKILPCSQSSQFPGDQLLLRPFNYQMQAVFAFHRKMYTTLTPREQLRQHLAMQTQHLDMDSALYVAANSEEFRDQMNEVSAPLFSTDGDDQDRRAESYMLTAFGLDAGSRRVTVGDAYSRLVARHAPRELTEMLLQASIRLGTNGSLRAAFEEAQSALAAQNMAAETTVSSLNAPPSEKTRSELERLQRLSTALLRQTTGPGVKRGGDGLEQMSSDKVKRLMTACSLRKGGDMRVRLQRDNEAYRLTPEEASRTIDLLSEAMRCKTETDGTRQQMQEVLTSSGICGKTSSAGEGLDRLLGAATHVLRCSAESSMTTMLTTPFFLSTKEAAPGIVGFHRLSPSGTLQASDPGDVFRAEQPLVLLAQHMRDGTSRLTSTKKVS